MKIHDLLTELKRRRVFRVAGAYVVGAWIVLQAADVLFPALHLPPWTVTLVAIAVILGFPIALILGWAFDITPGGIERAAVSAGSLRFPARAAMVATVLVALGVGGFVGVRRRAVAAKLDANAVVVLPFRVSGDAALSVMREGMVDIMVAKLTGDFGPRAIDSRTTLSAWRRKVENEKDDLPPADAVHLARALGAGQLLLGEIVSTPGKVSLSATLYSSIDGRSITKAEDTAPPDSMLPMVDRVVAKLLSQQAGQGHRTEALLSESLDAVRAYLDGQRAYRSGDYLNATRSFKAALAEDSTFALAGLGLMLTKAWSGYGPDFVRGRKVAWDHRDRLPAPDREYLIARLGEKYPVPTPGEQRLRAWQEIVAHTPDRVEAWYELGDVYFHSGSRLGIENPFDKALEAWGRASALDSTFMPALEHQFEVFADRGDTASMRRLADRVYSKMQPHRKYRSDRAWLTATALGDQDWLRGLRTNIDSVEANELRDASATMVRAGVPQSDLPTLIDAAVKRSAPAAKDFMAGTAAESYANMGKLSSAVKAIAEIPKDHRDGWAVALANAYPEMDNGELLPVATAMLKDNIPWNWCFAAMYRMRHGVLESAPAIIANVRKRLAEDPAAFTTTLDPCAAELDAKLKVITRAPDARAAVARLDSTIQHGAVTAGWVDAAILTSVQLHIALGDHEGALAVVRMRGPASWAYSSLLLEHARLAARFGHRDEAVSAYHRYLQVRAHPDGKAAVIANQARNELAALVGERAR